MNSYLLPLLVLIPLFGALIILVVPSLMPGTNKPGTLWSNALVTSLVTLLLTAVAVGVPMPGGTTLFDWSESTGAMQLTGEAEWVPAFGLVLGFGVDAFSMWLVILTTLIFPLALLATRDSVIERAREFYFWMLVLLASLIGAFVATDLIFFYICFEFTLVPLFFIISIHGGKQRLDAAKMYFFYTFTGSILTLGALIYLAWWSATATGVWTFSIAQLTASASTLPATAQSWVLLALLAGFAVKLAMFPFHSWKPFAYAEAPTAGSAILASLLLQLGVYGMVRIALPMTTTAVVDWAPLIATLGIIGILYAALIAWTQKALKPLIAFASVSHAGFILVGLMSLNIEGIGGAVAYGFNQGLITAALFLCVGMLQKRYDTETIANYSGLAKVMPVWSCFFVFFCFASVGVPGLNGFYGEFLALQGAFISGKVLGPFYAIFAASGIILAAVYILHMVTKIVFGPVKVPSPVKAADDNNAAVYAGDVNAAELMALAPLAAACLLLGLFPNLLLSPIEAPMQAVADKYALTLAADDAEPVETLAAAVQPRDVVLDEKLVLDDRGTLLADQRQELAQ